MCGIAGFSGGDPELLDRMAGALSHRGPDATGLFCRPGSVSLAHTRLSIVDLHARSDQPMRYWDGAREFVLVFNGEIYNYQELRKELLAEGCAFHTKSDSEVILAAYARWGERCVRRFNGMWAFALFDVEQNRLFLSRDRFGKKPLYYYYSDAHFVFASEVKAVIQAPFVSRVADRGNVSELLNFGLTGHNSGTFFEAVKQLPAGHNGVLDLARGRFQVSEYYVLPTTTNRATDDDIRDSLRAAVARRLISDVPICLSLSGGVDSSAIAAMIAELHDGRMVAFTTTSEQGAGDETRNVMQLLRKYPQFELVKVPLGLDDLDKTLARLVYHMDQPFIYDAPFVRYKVAESIHQHGFKVSVTGEGADELLGGYPVASHLFLLDLLRAHRFGKLSLELASVFRQPDWRSILSGFVAQFVRSRRGWFRSYLLDNARHMGCRVAPVSDGVPRLKEHDITLKEKLRSQIHTFFLPYLLTCNDKMYMAHAVEARAPFIDVEVVEQLLGIETDRLVAWALRKYPLRHAMRGRVPDSVLFDRHKIGFASPMRTELAAPHMKAWVRGLFTEARSAAFLDPRAFLAGYEALPVDTQVDDFALHAINLELWMREFDVLPS